MHGHLVPTIPRAKLGGPEHEEACECRESVAPEWRGERVPRVEGGCALGARRGGRGRHGRVLVV